MDHCDLTASDGALFKRNGPRLVLKYRGRDTPCAMGALKNPQQPPSTPEQPRINPPNNHRTAPLGFSEGCWGPYPPQEGPTPQESLV